MSSLSAEAVALQATTSLRGKPILTSSKTRRAFRMKKNLTERMTALGRNSSERGPAAPSGEDFTNCGKKGGIA
jgi:hypothetical protein